MPDKPSRPHSAKKSAVADPAIIFESLQEQLGTLDAVAIGDALDLALFSHLVLHIPLAEACRAYQRFKTQFVDWNEVRISTAKEVQEVLRHADEPLELAIFIKEFLNRLFNDHHRIGIEFLRDSSLSEIRSFFKRIPGFSECAVQLLLAYMKDYPVLPLETWMHPCVERLGLTKPSVTPLQKQKDVFARIERETAQALHFYLVEHSRAVCVVDPADIDCPNCVIQKACPFPRKKGVRKRATKKSTPRRSASQNGTGKKSK